jgi:hypothetical protein
MVPRDANLLLLIILCISWFSHTPQASVNFTDKEITEIYEDNMFKLKERYQASGAQVKGKPFVFALRVKFNGPMYASFVFLFA